MSNRLSSPPDGLVDWPVRSPSKTLEEGIVQIWTWRLDGPSPALEPLVPVDERKRASQFHFEQDQRRFIAARAGLRILLSALTATPPQQVPFSYGEFGKPSLAFPADSGIRFNLSHSDERAILAIARMNEVGVDLELVRHSEWAEPIASRYFAPPEAAALMATRIDERDQVFHRLWTHKEAIVKLLGAGLQQSLSSFITPSEKTGGEWIELPCPNPADVPRCWLATLPCDGHYQAALATIEKLRSIVLGTLDLQSAFEQ